MDITISTCIYIGIGVTILLLIILVSIDENKTTENKTTPVVVEDKPKVIPIDKLYFGKDGKIIITYIDFLQGMSVLNGYQRNLKLIPSNKYELMYYLFINGWNLANCFIMPWRKTEVQLWYNSKLDTYIDFVWNVNLDTKNIILEVLKKTNELYDDTAILNIINDENKIKYSNNDSDFIDMVNEINEYSEFDECQKFD